MNGHFDIGGVTPTKYFFSIAVVLGLLFAMTSADQQHPVALLFVQWQLQTVLPMALLVAAHILLLYSHWFTRLNPWFALGVSGAVGASLFAPLALLIDLWLAAELPASLAAELLDEWLSVMPPVTLCWVALNAPWLLGYRLEKSKEFDSEPIRQNDESTAEAESKPAFMSLVPPDKQGRLLLLKSELHYLQVLTDQGSSLILYNLGDAVDQLPQTSGMSVHRSYWVALGAIEKLEKRGRQGEISLRNGQRVPVSRNRLAEVSRRLAELPARTNPEPAGQDQ